MKRYLTILVNVAIIILCAALWLGNPDVWEIAVLALALIADCTWDAVEAWLS